MADAVVAEELADIVCEILLDAYQQVLCVSVCVCVCLCVCVSQQAVPDFHFPYPCMDPTNMRIPPL